MELLKKYWWVGLVLLFFVKIKRKDGTKRSIAKTVVDEIDAMINKQ